jgi:hypothetical protein
VSCSHRPRTRRRPRDTIDNHHQQCASAAPRSTW